MTVQTQKEEKVKSKSVLNGILLRKRLKISLTPGKESNSNYVKAMGINIASLGFIFSPELIQVLEILPVSTLTNLNKGLSDELSTMVGAHVKYRPLFKSFPAGVPDTFEYLIERIVGYLESNFDLTENAKLLSCGHLINTKVFDLANFGACPICQMQVDNISFALSKRNGLNEEKEKIKFKEITLGKTDEVFEIFKNLLSSTTSISAQDKEDIAEIFETNLDKVEKYFPSEIPHKEVLAFTSSLVLKHLDNFDLLLGKVKNATDVLRIAVSMSGGDISLAAATKFKNFSKKERRFFLTLLENCKNIEEDMSRHGGYWIRFGEILHPGDYKNRFPQSFEAFKKLRNNIKIETFNSKSEAYMAQGKILDLILHLKDRPSELGRKIDYIISNIANEKINLAIEVFTSVIGKIPTPTLLQIMSNFKIRTSENKKIRIIMPKGSLAKVKILDEVRTPMALNITIQINEAIQKELVNRFKKLPGMGKVYLDTKLSTYLVPSSQRSASKALLTIPKGSKVSLSDDDFVRMFIYWKEPSGVRTDVDLSAMTFDSDFNPKGQVSFTNYHEDGMVHSGDIQSAPKGAAEFIDIDKKKVIKSGVRYIAMQIYCYTQQPFVDMPESFAGIMGRMKAKSGEIFEPKTVKMKFDVTADAAIAIPMIIDLHDNKMIWTDLSLKGGRFLHANSKNIQRISQALSQMVDFKTNIFDLLLMHIEARGTIVNSPDEADLIFSEETISGQMDLIMSEYLI